MKYRSASEIGKTWLMLSVFLAGVSFSAASQDAAYYNQLGIESYDAGRFQIAIDYFERAYEVSPESDTVLHNLCNAHQSWANELSNVGRRDEAIRHLELAISIDPANASPLVQLGAYYLRNDEVSTAIFRLEESIELQPGLLDAHELLGEAYYRDNDLPAARAQWDYVLEQSPKRPGLQARYDKAFREESVELDHKRQGTRHFNVTYPKDISTGLRSTVVKILERAHFEIGRKFGGVYPPPPVQVILYSAEQFSEATQLGTHVGAVFDGKIRAPLTDAAGTDLSKDELDRRLTHEYVHVIVRYLLAAKAPWWLNEGLAEQFSHSLDAGQEALLREAFNEGTAMGLQQLEGSQLGKLDPQRLRLAYCQAQATVNNLWTRFGQRRMSYFLTDLASGISTEDALRNTYSKTYAMLDFEISKSFR